MARMSYWETHRTVQNGTETYTEEPMTTSKPTMKTTIHIHSGHRQPHLVQAGPARGVRNGLAPGFAPDFASMRELAGQTLDWAEGAAGSYELADAAGRRVARLRFEPAPGGASAGGAQYAALESAAGLWRVRSGGLARRQAAIRRQGDRVDLVCFAEDPWNGGGEVSFPDGPRFTARANCWLHTYRLESAAGEALVVYRSRPGASAGSMEVRPAAAGMAELPCLALFGWQLFLSLYQEARTQRHMAA